MGPSHHTASMVRCAFVEGRSAGVADRRRWISLGVVGLLGACGVSPKPEPPITVPKPPTFEAVPVVEADQGSTRVRLVGEPLTVDPGGGMLRVYNLETADPPAEAPIREDGGFDIVLPASPGDEVRLEVDSVGSAPRDWIVTEAGEPLREVDHPLGDCLSVTPGIVFLKPGSSETVTVEDTCGVGIELSAPRTRGEAGAFELGSAESWPMSLVAGRAVELTAGADKGSIGDEAIYFVEATAPEADRRAITVRLIE